MLQFKPYSDEELNELNNPSLLSDGEYTFTIRTAEESLSRSGIPMLKVSMSVSERLITDYILTDGKMAFKFKHFCASLNLLSDYQLGKIDLVTLRGKSGTCVIGSQKGNLKDDGTCYPDKNVIKDYVKSSHPAQPKSSTQPVDDDIPF